MNHTLKFFLLLFLFTTLRVFGQTTDSITQVTPKPSDKTVTKYTIGIIGGPNLFSFQNRNNPPQLMIGGGGGLSFQINFEKQVSLAIDLLAEKKTYGYTGNNYAYKYDLYSITLPIMYRRSLGRANYGYINAGGFFSTQFNAEYKGGYYIYSQNFNRGFVGIVAGLGARIPIGKKMLLTLEARDYYSLYKLYDVKTASYFDLSSAMSNTATFLVGISYGLGGTKDSTTTKQRKIFVKPFYSIKNSFRKQLEDVTIIQSSAYNTYRYNSEEEIPKICSEAGLLFEIRLSQYFNINTGLCYDERNFSTNKTNFTFTSISPGNPSTRILSDELNYKFQFLSLPVLLNVEKKIKNASIYIGTGIEVKRLLYSSMNFTHEYSNIASGSYKGNDFAYFWDIHLGASLPLSKKLFFFIEPTIENGLNKITLEKAELDLQLWSYGCRAGFRF